MKNFEYHRADSVEGALSLGGQFIAGGTNLLDLMKHEIETPDQLIDINHLQLDQVTSDGSGLRIGALVRNADLAADMQVRSAWPLLSRAILAGASGQIRNRATTAGNLMQRTRCPYFYDISAACNKRQPGSGCDAREGVNRNHAIFGTSEHCIATYPGDMAIALLTLDATVEIDGPQGSRTLPVADFHREPGDAPEKDNNLRPGEIIRAVTLPAPTGGKQVYRKVRDRRSYAFALVSVAADVQVAGGRITHAAIGMGGVGTKPWRNREAEKSLIGQQATRASFTAFADAVLGEARSFGDNDFKIPLLRRTLVAALAEATGVDLMEAQA